MTAQHTPRPWTSEWTNDVGPDDEYYVEFYEILDKYGNQLGTAKTKSDGRLIAAAPDLLEALKNARRFVVSSHQPVCTELDDIDAAIAKATGEQA